MKRFIVLDSAPLGLLFQRPGVVQADRCREWAKARMAAGARLFVPEIIRYEIRRELLRLRMAKTLAALDGFIHAEPDRLLGLTSRDLERAAELWAQSRRRGMPTAGARALDIDVILAAQTQNLGVPLTDLIVATSNKKHLSQFVPSDDWATL